MEKAKRGTIKNTILLLCIEMLESFLDDVELPLLLHRRLHYNPYLEIACIFLVPDRFLRNIIS